MTTFTKKNEKAQKNSCSPLQLIYYVINKLTFDSIIHHLQSNNSVQDNFEPPTKNIGLHH